MRTIKEIKDELTSLEQEEFLLQMKDHWSTDDYDLNKELRSKIKELRRELANRDLEDLVKELQ